MLVENAVHAGVAFPRIVQYRRSELARADNVPVKLRVVSVHLE
jgi:hypothetical protein